MQLLARTIPLMVLAILCLSLTSVAELVDTGGNIATNETALGDIDMAASSVGDLSFYITTGAVAQAVSDANTYTDSSTNTVSTDIKQWVTNSVVVGYTEWSYTGSVVAGHDYSITSQESGGSYTFSLFDLTASELIGNVTTNLLNPTELVYPYSSGAITASREEIRRNCNGFALYSDVKRLEDHIETMDTSYFRFATITNVNQSVQYVYSDANTTELRIMMPETGMTKDWLVYILAETNLTLNLPPATYWGASDSVTNAVPAYTPTALYFTQITDNTFSIGRKEFIPITVDSAMTRALKQARSKSRLGAARLYRPTPSAPVKAKEAVKPKTGTETTAKAATTATTAKAATK